MRLKKKVMARVRWIDSQDPFKKGDTVMILNIDRGGYKIYTNSPFPISRDNTWFVFHEQLEVLERKEETLTLKSLINLTYEIKSFNIKSRSVRPL